MFKPVCDKDVHTVNIEGEYTEVITCDRHCELIKEIKKKLLDNIEFLSAEKTMLGTNGNTMRQIELLIEENQDIYNWLDELDILCKEVD